LALFHRRPNIPDYGDTAAHNPQAGHPAEGMVLLTHSEARIGGDQNADATLEAGTLGAVTSHKAEHLERLTNLALGVRQFAFQMFCDGGTTVSCGCWRAVGVHRLEPTGAQQSRKHAGAILVDLVTLQFHSRVHFRPSRITKSPALDSACTWLLPPHASLLPLLCLWDGAMS